MTITIPNTLDRIKFKLSQKSHRSQTQGGFIGFILRLSNIKDLLFI